MRTQGISLMTSKSSGQVSPAKTTKATDATFDSFISNSASRTGDKLANTSAAGATDAQKSFSVKKAGVNDSNSNKPADAASSISGGQDKRLDLNGKQSVKTADAGSQNGRNSSAQQEWTEEAMVAAATAVVDLLQTMLGLPAEDIQDILEQMGVSANEFVLTMQDMQMMDGTGMELVQDFVMQFHGITDKAVFLTNDSLSGEVEMLTERISQLLEEPAEFDSVVANMAADITEDAADMDGFGESQDMPEEGIDSLPVVVEDQRDSESSEQDGFGERQSGRTDIPTRGAETSHDAPTTQSVGAQFTERLSQAFTNGTEESVSSADQTMFRIVEQVVSQVRVRVMSSTTSMELQLHPASLGKVALQVATTALGTATATLTVENQAAKEALESQMIILKEAFEEQGLKVDAVEVTVSEFGLDHQDRQAGDDRQNSSGRGKHSRFSDEDANEQSGDSDSNETESARRDQNSVVDYTA